MTDLTLERAVPWYRRYAVVERRYPLIHEVRILSTHLTQARARRAALRRIARPGHQDILQTRVEPTDAAPVRIAARRMAELLTDGPRSVAQLTRLTALSPLGVVAALLHLSRLGLVVCRSPGAVRDGRPGDAVWRLRSREEIADLLGHTSNPPRVDYLRGSG